jgi:hypothetical protein
MHPPFANVLHPLHFTLTLSLFMWHLHRLAADLPLPTPTSSTPVDDESPPKASNPNSIIGCRRYRATLTFNDDHILPLQTAEKKKLTFRRYQVIEFYIEKKKN